MSGESVSTVNMYLSVVDYEFLEHLLAKNLGKVKEMFPKLFSAKAYPMVTECLVREAKSKVDNAQEVLKLMDRFERAPCGHEKGEKTGEECLRDCFATPRYCLAGRSKWSLKLSYYYPHVPVLMWDLANVLVLRSPSNDAKQAVEDLHEAQRFHATDLERKLTNQAILDEKRERAEQNKELSAKINYRMRFAHKPVAKGPHPLSMLKRQTPEERQRSRSLKNRFESFGGDSTSHDPSLAFMSRAKLRRKRTRSKSSSLPSEEAPNTQQVEPNISHSDPTPDPQDDLPDLQPVAKKVRPRRRPKPASNQIHTIREDLRAKDAQIEAATELN